VALGPRKKKKKKGKKERPAGTNEGKSVTLRLSRGEGKEGKLLASPCPFLISVHLKKGKGRG